MKKHILFAVLVWVAVCAAATDRLYIEDLTIEPGQTRTVSILLDNTMQYTAFQTDIYLPEGLTVEQDDGDYVFELTQRKANDHIITSQRQTDGSIRLLSYSPYINAYSGNSGALVTFNVIATDDFVGPAIVQVNHTLCTTSTGIEMALADETCTVMTSGGIIPGDVDGDGKVGIADVTDLSDLLLEGSLDILSHPEADVDSDGRISIADITEIIDMLLASN